MTGLALDIIADFVVEAWVLVCIFEGVTLEFNEPNKFDP
jgi:hypothetical protein